jgi:hypothetical protein
MGDGCHHVYLDIGSNIGVQVRKLFEPEKYPRAAVLRKFDQVFGPPAARLANGAQGLCAFGFEANPSHWPRLKEIEKAYSLRGWRVHFFPSAAGIRDGNITLWSDNEFRHKEWGASTAVSSRSHSKGARTPFQVPVTDLAKFILGEIHGRAMPDSVQGRPPPHVLMKLDIEGGEYTVLRKLTDSGALCSTISSAFIEEHRWAMPEVRRDHPGMPLMGVAEVQQYVRDQQATNQKCPFQILNLDDESYLEDGKALQ